jgi:hypothetical protein
VAGFVVAAALLRGLLGRASPLGTFVPAAVALLLAVLVVPSVWAGMRGADGVRDSFGGEPAGTTEREKCLVDGGQGDVVGLVDFVVQRVPPDAHMAVHGPVPQVCLQLSLLPRMFVRDTEPHQFTLYTGDIPAGVRTRPGAQPYGDTAVLVPEG